MKFADRKKCTFLTKKAPLTSSPFDKTVRGRRKELRRREVEQWCCRCTSKQQWCCTSKQSCCTSNFEPRRQIYFAASRFCLLIPEVIGVIIGMVISSSPVVVIAVLIIILLPVLVVLSLSLLGRVAQEEGRDAVKEILDVLNLEKFGCTPPRQLTSVSASLDSVSNYVNINSICKSCLDITSEAMKSLTACCVGAAFTKVGTSRTRQGKVNRLNYY